MFEDMSNRLKLHRAAADLYRQEASGSNEDRRPAWALARAVHEAAATYATSCIEARSDGTEIQELGEDLAALKVAADAHQAAIEKAVQGLAPWGEIKAAGADLQAALARVFTR